MTRGELIKKLFASYRKEEAFRDIAAQIIKEEENKNNKILAKSLKKALDSAVTHTSSGRVNGLSKIPHMRQKDEEYVEAIEPRRSDSDIVLSKENERVLFGLTEEFRKSEEIRKFGLEVRSKVIFCGPPGCGKTLCAEVFASHLGLPLYIVKIDQLISSYLGETAANIRKIFELAQKRPCVLFFDEFDALARAREHADEHNELRRVVNSLLVFIDRIVPMGFIIAATNLDQSLDSAIWRRFDEVLWFELPDQAMIEKYLKFKFKNVALSFQLKPFVSKLDGNSYADIEKICEQAIKSALINKRKKVLKPDFSTAVLDHERRKSGRK